MHDSQKSFTHNHHLSLLSSPACSLLFCPLSPVLALFPTVVMQRAFRGIVFFIFIWSCAQLTAQESFPLSTGMLCVLQGEPSQPSICFVPLLLVCACSCVYPCHLQFFCPHCRAWWGVLPQEHCPLSSHSFYISLVIMLIKNQHTKTKMDLTVQQQASFWTDTTTCTLVHFFGSLLHSTFVCKCSCSSWIKNWLLYPG